MFFAYRRDNPNALKGKTSVFDCSLEQQIKALSTPSQKSEIVTENGETTATVSLFSDRVDRL